MLLTLIGISFLITNVFFIFGMFTMVQVGVEPVSAFKASKKHLKKSGIFFGVSVILFVIYIIS